MSILSTLATWATSQKTAAQALNRVLTELGKLQGIAGLTYYEQNGVNVITNNFTTGVQSIFGPWPTRDGFTGLSTGALQVPEAGYYVVQASIVRTSGAWDNLTNVTIRNGSTEIARVSVSSSVTEQKVSVCTITELLAAGDDVSVWHWENSGFNVTATCGLTVVRLPIDV